MRLGLIMGQVTSACNEEIMLNKPNLALPHGSGEVPPFNVSAGIKVSRNHQSEGGQVLRASSAATR